MFEDDIDGNGIPCDHPITVIERILAWLHGDDRFHTARLCDAFDRVKLDYPCRQCEANRGYEYGILFKDDKDVLKRWGRYDYDEE